MKKQPQPFLEIHPKDAHKLNVEPEMLVEVRSRRGAARFPARITEAIAPGTVFVPMHWGALWTDNGEANLLTHPESCPISLEPELKACAVNLTPVTNYNVDRDRAQTSLPTPSEKSMSLKS